MKLILPNCVFLSIFAQNTVSGFTVARNSRVVSSVRTYRHIPATLLFNAENPSEEEVASMMEKSKLSTEEVEEVGNLVADDEWLGLGMELSELVRVAVIEEAKKNTSDFIGKEDYKVGDITKEIDDRVKTEVAKIRGKDEYELGDLTVGLDKIGKDMVCELTGKDDYEAGDLSTELDTRVKASVAEFCGKDEYEVGDLSNEIDKRSRARVLDFIGKENYQFGDITKKALTGITGKDEYEFGDVSKKLMKD